MNIKEAYSILGVDDGISDEALKKHHRSLAAKYHPDIYKEDPDKLKNINAAYQYVQEYRTNPPQTNPFDISGFNFSDFGNYFNDVFGGFSSRSRRPSKPIQQNISISFEEAILGCQKEIAYQKQTKCNDCNGVGFKRTGNGCSDCNGFGQITTNQGNMIFQRTCSKCFGRGIKKDNCKTCSQSGTLPIQTNLTVSIPPGISHHDTLRVQGQGSFSGTSFNQDLYEDVFVTISVENKTEMVMKGKDVISHIDISLLEAFIGCNKTVATVYGDKEITIPKLTKHKDEILINNCGVKNTNGKHRVILTIVYPNDTSKIIQALQDDTNNTEVN